MPPAFVHNAHTLDLPPLADVCKAVRWASLGAQSALEDTWRGFDAELNGDEAALAVQ